MSVRIAANLLTHAQKLKLRQDLTFTPMYRGKPSGNAVRSYKTDDTSAYIPMRYAIDNLGLSNDNNPHTKIAISHSVDLGAHSIYQRQCIKDVVTHLNASRTAILHVRPGAGKTIMSCVLATVVGLRTLILVHNTDQIEQWYNSLTSQTDAKVWRVCDPKTKKQIAERESWQIAVCYIRRTKFLSEEEISSVGFLVADEIPLHCNLTGVAGMLACQPKFMLGCSAQATRSRDKMDRIVDVFVGKNYVETDEILDMKCLIVETPYEGVRVSNARGDTDNSEHNKSLLFNEERNELLTSIAARLVAMGRKLLITTNEKKHVLLLVEMLDKISVDCDYIMQGKNSFRDCPVLVGIIQKCGVGFDEKALSPNFSGKRIDTVMDCSGVANAEGIIQLMGRGFRADDRLFILIKDSDSIIEARCRKAKTILRNKKKYSTEFYYSVDELEQ